MILLFLLVPTFLVSVLHFILFLQNSYFFLLFSSADYSQAELIWYKFVRSPSAYVNFFKSLLLLLDSFETRYSYFLGQSRNFVLFRILKFGFSDFLWIFIKIHWNCYFSYIFQWILLKLGTLISWVSPQTLFFSEFWNLDFLIFLLWIFIKFSLKSLLQFPMDSFETRYTYYLGQSSHLLLFSFLKFALFFYEFSSNFHWNRYCSYSFQWIPLKLGILILWVSLHIFFSDFWNVYFFGGGANFYPIFIQIATAPAIFNGFHWN